MELTNEQIGQVEKFLETKNFDYVDLKIEVLDHIVSDIENYLDKNHSFENAFSMVKIRWEKHFRETSSFYFGLFYPASKIIIKSALKIFKPFYFLYLASYFLPLILLKYFPISFGENVVKFVNGFLFYTSLVALIYMLFMMVQTKIDKRKTTYSFILKTQYLGSIFIIFGGFFGNIFNNHGEMNAVFTGFMCAGFSVVFICHYFYKKHQEAIKTYNIS